MPLALFGINSGGLNLAVDLIVLFLVVLWLALVAWTYLDARRRIEDNVLVLCATVASLFPFVGTLVYTILRPPEYLEDAREREVEVRAAELRVRQLTEQSCPNCEHPIERTYLRCPNCRARLKDPCPSCSKPLDPRWSVCPYCEMPVRQVRKRKPSTTGRERPSSRSRTERSEPQRASAPRSKRAAPVASEEEEEAPKPARRSRRVKSKSDAAASADSAPARSSSQPPPTEEAAAVESGSPESRPTRTS